MSEPKAKPGRKPIHASQADRAAAYRERKAEALNKLRTTAESAPDDQSPDRFSTAIGEGLRQNAINASEIQRIKSETDSAAANILRLIDLAAASGRQDINVEIRAMETALAFLQDTIGMLEYAEIEVTCEARRGEIRAAKELEHRLTGEIDHIFGTKFNQRDPLIFGRSIVDFETGREHWARQRGYSSCIIDGLTGEDTERSLRSAVDQENKKACARVIAQIKLIAAPEGKPIEGSQTKIWLAGWNDVEAYANR
jgi:hypothetical protein